MNDNPTLGRPVPQPVERTYKFGRKAFIAGSAATVGALFLGRNALSSVPVPRISLLPAQTSVDGFTIYTVTNGFPTYDPATFRVKIDGMVKNPLSFSLNEFLSLPHVTETRFYQCVTGWSVPNTRWTGVRLASLLDRAQPHPDAHALTFYSFDGIYTESLTMEQARQSDVLLAYKLDGAPLSRAQGAPLRLVVPGMYGYKFIKWLHRVELVPAPIDGYWEQNGYDRDAYIGHSNGV